MGKFYKPLECQNTTKTKYKKSKTAVTGECGNNVKATGMAGIWSGAFTRRQLWEGGRESRSGEWALHGSLPACHSTHDTPTCTHMCTSTRSCIIYNAKRPACPTHTQEQSWQVIYSSWKLLLTVKVSALGCRKLKQGTDGRRGRERTGEGGREVRGVSDWDRALNSSDQRLLSKQRAKNGSRDYSCTMYKLYINT